eukprot:TRINITY_DN1168_c0_g1_i1.p1 TRINITY_DN1168_c0_g1~~TRINITY_DN1168_c0_g1_i1.p1  ORF type:complete len:628 (+),score=236.25 TRINITY_DN1168_c0_g1_i1:58-1941(+)
MALSRHLKGPAPPTPKRMRKDPHLSLVASFDELVREGKILSEGSAEEEFLHFVMEAKEWRRRWGHAEVELSRLRSELNALLKESSLKDLKFRQARGLIEDERKRRVSAENERDALRNHLSTLKDFILGDKETKDETREKIKSLERSVLSKTRLAFLSPNSLLHPNAQQSSHQLNRLTEESAESILDVSDLSYDESLNLSRRNPRRSTDGRPRRVSRAPGCSEGGERLLVSTTTVSATPDGQLLAESVLQTENFQQPNMETFEERAKKSRLSREIRRAPEEPSAPPMEPPDMLILSPPATLPAHPVKRALSNAGQLQMRPHPLVRKKLFKEEDCGPCGGKIKLGRSRYKCRDCGATAHMDCKEHIPLPCVPAALTPVKPGYLISDYTPQAAPMIPALLIHCLREIESRGLSELGLYRVSGPEKEATELLDKFSRNKGAPSLGKYDLGTITSCVKKFLRSLKEPLVPASMWRSFVDASCNPDSTYAEGAIFQCISELPRPNRDTLAFLMLHFQKIAASPETKMCVDNIARIFGPTIVGYSSPDPSVILAETPLQKDVMSTLLNISNDYWDTFVNAGEDAKGSKYIGTPEAYFPPGHTPGTATFRAPSERKSKKFKSLHPARQIFQSPMI